MSAATAIATCATNIVLELAVLPADVCQFLLKIAFITTNNKLGCSSDCSYTHLSQDPAHKFKFTQQLYFQV